MGGPAPVLSPPPALLPSWACHQRLCEHKPLSPQKQTQGDEKSLKLESIFFIYEQRGFYPMTGGSRQEH